MDYKHISQVRQYKGKPALFIDGKPENPFLYALTDRFNGYSTWEKEPNESIKKFASIGCHIFQVDANMENLIIDDKVDINFIKKQVQGITKHCANASIMLRLHVNPTISWINNHPNELVKYADIESIKNDDMKPTRSYTDFDLRPLERASFASKVWLEEYTIIVKEIINQIENCNEGNNIFAIQIANGIYGENHYWAAIKYNPDVSTCMQNALTEYLINKYKNVTELRKAYKNNSINFEDIKPAGMDRNDLNNGIFRDPAKTKAITDYYECQHTLVANSIIHFANVIKEESNNRLLCGAFYGYYFSLFGRGAAAGHLAEQLILNCDNIDFLSAPQAYGKMNRTLGGPAISRGLIESARLHGKLWLDEMDQPTHLGSSLGGMLVFDKQDSLYNNRKHVLESFIRGGGCWYYDFGSQGQSGWWNDDFYLSDNKKLKELTERMFDCEYENFADVLLVYDTKTLMFSSPEPDKDPITDSMMNIFTIEAFKSGASVETIYLSDIKNVKLEKYKVVVFVNTYYMDNDVYEYIQTKVKKEVPYVVFFSFPGYLSDDGFSMQRTETLLEMHLKQEIIKLLPVIKYEGDFALGEDQNLDALYIEKKAQNYVQTNMFAVLDDDVEILAKYEDGYVAGCKKNNIYYFALPLTSCNKISTLFKKCSVHIFRESENATLIGSGIIELNANEEEKGNINLPSGKKVNYSLKCGEVAVYDIKTGEKLL